MAKLNYGKYSKQWTKAKENASAEAQERAEKQEAVSKVACPRGYKVIKERVSGTKKVENYIVPTKTRRSKNGGAISHTPLYEVKSDTVPAYEPWQMRKAIYHGEVSKAEKVTYKPSDFRFFG